MQTASHPDAHGNQLIPLTLVPKPVFNKVTLDPGNTTPVSSNKAKRLDAEAKKKNKKEESDFAKQQQAALKLAKELKKQEEAALRRDAAAAKKKVEKEKAEAKRKAEGPRKKTPPHQVLVDVKALPWVYRNCLFVPENYPAKLPNGHPNPD